MISNAAVRAMCSGVEGGGGADDGAVLCGGVILDRGLDAGFCGGVILDEGPIGGFGAGLIGGLGVGRGGRLGGSGIRS